MSETLFKANKGIKGSKTAVLLFCCCLSYLFIFIFWPHEAYGISVP